VWTLAVISLAVWLLGVGTGLHLHGYIHLFLALAIVAMFVQLMSSRQSQA